MAIGPRSVLRLVLDTNTVLSGLLWGGIPAKLIVSARTGEIALWCSRELLDEFHDVIHRDKFSQPLDARGLNPDDLFNGYAALCKIAKP